MIILVNGLMAYGAGKTSLARAIFRRAQNVGLDFWAFKPKSAHNYWDHLDHSKVCQELGTLVSKDALTLRELCRDPPDLELMNPYHQLVCPIDLTKVSDEEEHLLADPQDPVLAERLTCLDTGSILYINRRADLFAVHRDFLGALKGGVSRVEWFGSSPLGEGLAPVDHCVRVVFETLASRAPNLVVESSSDVPLPLEVGNGEIDLVLSVGGPAVFSIAPADLLGAVEVLPGRSMRELLKYVKPLSSWTLPHLSSGEMDDERVMEKAYEKVLDGIWDAL